MILTLDGNNVSANTYQRSIKVDRQKNNRIDHATFKLFGNTPTLNDDVLLTLNGEKQFAGVLLSAKSKTVDNSIEYECKAVDYTHWLTRKQFTQRYTNTTVNAIIADILTYEPRISATYVDADIDVESISFNRSSLSDAIDKLAELTNYSWYVDYDKNLHFFAQSSQNIAHTLNATSKNFLWQSLEIERDLSQLRNIVTVKGSETEGATRTITVNGDGENLQFDTTERFATEPTVTVDGVAQTVGLEYIDTGFDCYWSYNEKYIRFETMPADGAVIEMTGKPVLPIIVEVKDDDSIEAYGDWNYYIEDEKIDTQDKAISRGIAELENHAKQQFDGQFQTYDPTFFVGQRINVSCHGIDDDFVVQSVKCQDFVPNSDYEGMWTVKFVSAETIGIIRILQRLLRNENIDENERKTLLRYFGFKDKIDIADDDTTISTSSAPYVLADENGDVSAGKTPFKLNFSVLEP